MVRSMIYTVRIIRHVHCEAGALLENSTSDLIQYNWKDNGIFRPFSLIK